MNIKIVSLIVLSVLIAACTGNIRTDNPYMTVENPSKQYFPDPGHALLIIERTDAYGWNGYNMIIWDVTDTNYPNLIGYLAPTMKSAIQLKPGHHKLTMYIVDVNLATDVTVEAGKTYYAKVGVGGKGIQFFPEKNGQEHVMTNDNISLPTNHLIDWGLDRDRIENSLPRRIKAGLLIRSKQTTEERTVSTILAEDGR